MVKYPYSLKPYAIECTCKNFNLDSHIFWCQKKKSLFNTSTDNLKHNTISISGQCLKHLQIQVTQ